MPVLMNLSYPYLADQSQYESLPSNDEEKKILKNFFPHQLMEILSSPFFSDCAAWTYNESSFFITDPEEFAKKYDTFCQRKTASKKESFARKLNRWGFMMESNKGPLCGSYSHPLFNKNKPCLCEQMSCNKKRRLQYLNRNCLGPSNETHNISRKKRKCSVSSPSQTKAENDDIPKVPDPVGSLYDTSIKLPRASVENLLAKPYCGDQNALLDEDSLRKEIQLQQMMKMFELNMRTRKSHLGDMQEPQDSYCRIHSTIVKDAMMALL